MKRREGRFCGARVSLPVDHYVVREKRLRRLRHPSRILFEEPGPVVGDLDGLVNVGPDSDEIWVEQSLTEAEKRFVVIHELVHARRQMSGEEFADTRLEEFIVELEAIARADLELLDALPNGLAMVILHNYLTARGTVTPHTGQGLRKVHERIGLLLGGIKVTAC